MNKVLSLLVLLCGVLMTVTGIQWLVVPGTIAPQFGLELANGVGLSSQVGDMSAFFLTLGICTLLALTLKQRVWYYPAILLVSLTALGRILAWLLHDAAMWLQCSSSRNRATSPPPSSSTQLNCCASPALSSLQRRVPAMCSDTAGASSCTHASIDRRTVSCTLSRLSPTYCSRIENTRNGSSPAAANSP